MSTIRKRLDDLQAARARQEKRKGDTSPVEEIRAMLEGVDGQADLGALPGETLWDTMVRRLQPIDGWNLDQIPGDSLEARIKTIDDAANTGVVISDEARHAARHWFELVEGV